MVVVRAAFNQHWRGNFYHGPDGDIPGEIIPATPKQAERLTQSKQGYYDIIEETESEEDD